MTFMSAFTTRIELHDNASYWDYARLHEAMEENGFSRYIVSTSGVKYHLPEAEYYSLGTNRAEVLFLAKTAAKTTGNSFSVLVTGDSGMIWEGLAPVK